MARLPTYGSWPVSRPCHDPCANPTAGPGVNVTMLTSYTPDGNIADNHRGESRHRRSKDALSLRHDARQRRRGRKRHCPQRSACRDPLSDAADSADSIRFAYNRQSQVNWMQDQNGNVHEYDFDGLARRLADIVSLLGAGVHGAVRRIDTAYDIRGMMNLITSRAGTEDDSTIVNQVTLIYDAFAQLLHDKQDQSASGGPNVTVDYVRAAATATSNSARLSRITYPYFVGRAACRTRLQHRWRRRRRQARPADFVCLRQQRCAVAAYKYFGLASTAETDYVNGAISCQLASGSSYPGLDLFGRIIDLPWSQSSPGDLARLKYGYDLAGNRTFRQDVAATDAEKAFDELYSYDGIQRLIAAARGTFSSPSLSLDGRGRGEGALPPISGPTLQQSWGLDATGNWSGFNSFDFTTAANSVVQQRAATRRTRSRRSARRSATFGKRRPTIATAI